MFFPLINLLLDGVFFYFCHPELSVVAHCWGTGGFLVSGEPFVTCLGVKVLFFIVHPTVPPL